MANYSVLKAAVQAVVKTNGNQEITGANLQSTLISIINSLGTGYQFMGVATPSTSPGTPDYNVAYIGGAGTYANFGTSYTVPVGSIGVFKYNGSWVKEQIRVENVGVFDISAFNAVGGTLATYTDLEAALGTNGANIPEGVRNGGMSIKFVQSSDNKYVQYFLTKKGWSTSVGDWEKMNLEEGLKEIQAKIGNDISWTVGNAYKTQGVLNPGPIPIMAYSSIFKVNIGDTIIVRSLGKYVAFISEWTNDGQFVRTIISQDTTSEVAEYSYTFDSDTYVRICYSYAVEGSNYEIKRNSDQQAESIVGKYNWVKGYYYNDSLQIGKNVNYERCLIDVTSMSGLSYFIKVAVPSNGLAYMSFVDDGGNIIEQYRPQGYITGIIPANATKLYLSNRFMGSTPFQSVPIVIIANAYDMPSLPEIIDMFTSVQENILNGKKISFLGDSITEGIGASPSSKRYSSVMCAISGAIENNLGLAGSALATNAYNRADSTRFAARATFENLSGSDLIIIFGGTNDFSYDTKAIGELFSEQVITPNGRIGGKVLGPISDTDTFAGALHDLINLVRTNCPNVPILLITPLNRGNFSATTPNSKQCNVNGNYLKDFTQAIKEIGAFYSIPVLDMSKSELDFSNAIIASTYSADNLHPNNAGHEIIAKLILSYIEQNMIINP